MVDQLSGDNGERVIVANADINLALCPASVEWDPDNPHRPNMRLCSLLRKDSDPQSSFDHAAYRVETVYLNTNPEGDFQLLRGLANQPVK